MSKTDDPERNIPWGTWEELLLACAVNRHGTKNWDSVAMEIQNRTSSPLILTAQNCKQKYLDLQRRFVAVDDKTDGGDDESEKDDKKKIPWLEELRKLRVAELRREVQRYDVSIVSLQLKVKKLKEERERSLEETENDDEKADLAKEETKNEGDTEKEKDGEERSSPENVDGKRISGEDSDRENQSFNESNSTDPKDKQRETEGEKRPEDDAGTTAGKPDPTSRESPEEKAVGEGSYNGSSDTVAKGAAAAKSPAPTPAPDTGESAEFRESVAESKGEGVEGAKESSDVQSSASLSRKRRRRKAISGCSSGEEPEADDVSPVSKRVPVKSQPLVGFLEIIRSHKHGSVFERRLECQEGGDYQSMIRQHVDLEMVRTKLEEGLYADGSLEFFRDLLLLFNNAIVFFPKNSSEQTAATALRAVVSKEMARSIPKPYTLSKERTPPPRPQPSLPKPNSEPSISLPGKPNSTGPLIACRKRSSISSKAHPVVAAEMKKEAVEIDRKPDAADLKEPDNSSANMVVEPRVTKKRSMDRSAPRGTRTSKTRSNNINIGARNSNPSVNPNPSPSSNSNAAAAAKAGGSNESSDGKAEKKNSNSASVAKKRSAANFLNRMKRSLSSNGTLLETLKGSVGNGSGSNSRGAEQKKGGRGDSRRDQGHRQASVGKQVQEQSSPVAAKRSVGRPPKRATAAAAAASAPPSRRGKDAVEAEAKPPPRKRARR